MPVPTMTTSQSLSYEAEGSLDRDITDVLINISPDSTPFLSSLPELEAAHEMKIEWQTDELRPPKKNQRPEFDEYTYKKAPGVGRLANYCQILREDGQVSDVMQKAWKTYKPKTDEYSRLVLKKIKELAKDTEYAIMANAGANPEDANGTLAMMGGIPYWMQEELLAVTVAATGTVTTAIPHGLETGRWVVFKGDTLPTGIEANKRYYVRLDETAPATVFTIFNSIQDAIENVNPITLTDTGSNVSILLNNIVDAADTKFTLDHINTAMELAYMRGGEPTDIWLSPANKRRFSELTREILNVTINRDQSNKRAIDVTDVYESDFGTLTCRAHRDCVDDKIYILDPNYWGLRWFDKAHVIADSELAKTGSFKKFVVTTTLSLQASQPLASVAITNVQR